MIEAEIKVGFVPVEAVEVEFEMKRMTQFAAQFAMQ